MQIRTPMRVLTATVSFPQLSAFSVQYMLEHANPTGNDCNPEDALVYLMDNPGDSIRSGLVDANLAWVELGETIRLGWHPVHNRNWRTWRGFTAACPYGFRWRSCTNNQLDAQAISDRPGWYAVECAIPDGRPECGFVEIFKDLGVVWQQEPAPGNGQNQDVEPDWASNEYALARPSSGC